MEFRCVTYMCTYLLAIGVSVDDLNPSENMTVARFDDGQEGRSVTLTGQDCKTTAINYQ